MMQAFRTENNYRNASRLSAAELRAAMASREILQSIITTKLLQKSEISRHNLIYYNKKQ